VNPYRLVVVVLALAPLGCGGGDVDPGFYEPVIVARGGGDAPSTSAHARPSQPGPRFDRPKLVLITADWCTFCQAARPSIMDAYEPFRAKVELVELDVTDDFTTKESLRVAEEEGVRSFFERFHGRTPTVGVFVGVEDGRLVHGDLEDPETLTRELDHAVRLMTQAPERDTVEAEHR
jgi:thiol-disulfide isomerase/thioredoxin